MITGATPVRAALIAAAFLAASVNVTLGGTDYAVQPPLEQRRQQGQRRVRSQLAEDHGSPAFAKCCRAIAACSGIRIVEYLSTAEPSISRPRAPSPG